MEYCLIEPVAGGAGDGQKVCVIVSVLLQGSYKDQSQLLRLTCFRGLIHHHLGGKHGGTQADVVLEEL